MIKMPTNACDCHVHVIGKQSLYPFDPARVYTPSEATTRQLDALHKRIGIDRVVLVQPSIYGTDNSCMLDALPVLGHRARAVAVIGPETSEAELAGFHAAGVRGVRVNIATIGMNDPAKALEMLQITSQRVAAYGWHVQLLAKPVVIADLDMQLAKLPTPLVVDHFGLPDIAKGPEQPGFAHLLRLVESGRVFVKLSAIERLSGASRGGALTDYIRALAAANRDALLWGSDWPHTGGGRGAGRSATDIEPFEPLDDAQALAVLANAVDADTLRRVLVDTPARLYDFPQGDA